MSKSMKKNFGSVGKALNADAREKRRRPSVGSATQSTRVNSVTVEMLREKEKDHILAVRLSRKRPAYQVQDDYSKWAMSHKKQADKIFFSYGEKDWLAQTHTSLQIHDTNHNI